MDSENLSKKSELSQENQHIPGAYVIVEEVPNSQNPPISETEFNPFLSHSQYLSQPGPSTQGACSAVVPFSATRRKRGRPSRSSYQLIKPTRGSERRKNCPKVLNYDTFKNTTWEWTERDRQLLLTGCLEIGIEDIEALREEFLPHKTENDIKNQIAMWRELAQKKLETLPEGESDVFGVKTETIKKLDEWIKYLKEKTHKSNASMFAMSNYFSILAEYGVFPSPDDCGGFDMRAIYRSIHCMMNGIPTYGLDRVTANVLLTCMDNVLQKLDQSNIVHLEEHLVNRPVMPDIEKFGKNYSRKVNNASAKPIVQILSNPVMNPLSLSETAMIKLFQDYEDSEDGS